MEQLWGLPLTVRVVSQQKKWTSRLRGRIQRQQGRVWLEFACEPLFHSMIQRLKTSASCFINCTDFTAGIAMNWHGKQCTTVSQSVTKR